MKIKENTLSSRFVRTNSTVDLHDLRLLKSKLALQGISFSKWLRNKIRGEVKNYGRQEKD